MGNDRRLVRARSAWAVCALGALGFLLSPEAQLAIGQSQPAQPPAQEGQQPPAALAAPGQPGADPGRGGRGGRGGAGGPGATDPANAGADFTKQPPVIPVSAVEQQKHFLLQPGYHIAPVL